MLKMIKVNYRNIETKEFPVNTSLYEISKYFSSYYEYPILIGKVDNNLTELNELITRNAKVDFFDRSNGVGNSVYGRSLQYILIKAVNNLFSNDVDVIIEHSLDKGFYCEITGININKDIVKKIEREMYVIVNNRLPFTKVSVSRADAIAYFKKKKSIDKVKSLKYISNTYINLYKLDDMYDYFYGKMASNTSDIDSFKLTYVAENGFVVSYPDVYNPECTLDYKHHKMLYQKFVDYSNWGKTLGINNASDLNNYISTGKYGELIRLSEAYYNNQLSNVADLIYNKKDKVKIVLMAGPSSSGKTTTSKRLEVYLRSKGLITHQISVDDYFLDRKDTPKDENGEYDFESISAVDVTLFNKHLSSLLMGEKVNIPEYNFVLGKREYKDKYLQLGNNDIILIEGIHALNDELTSSIDNNTKFKIYIGPLTQLNIDYHNRIHTSDTRKLRRIVRDNKYRGYNAATTLHMWKKIREGEEKNIFPYQDSADYVINSALIYELGVLKTYVEPLLFSVEENDPMYPEAIRLINFLRTLLPIPSDEIPIDSVLREFIGGSCFY